MLISTKPLNPTIMSIVAYDQNRTNEQHDKVTSEALKLARDKNDDYGSSWTILRLSSVTAQAFAKALRIRSIQDAGKQEVADSIRSDFIGIMNYAAMGLALMEPNIANDFHLSKERQNELLTNAMSKARALMIKKNHDYGEAFRIFEISALLDLILQRLVRMKAMHERNGMTKVSEGLDQNYCDLINYAVFCVIRLDEGADQMK